MEHQFYICGRALRRSIPPRWFGALLLVISGAVMIAMEVATYWVLGWLGVVITLSALVAIILLVARGTRGV